MGRNARILVVDGEMAMLERLKLFLNESGYAVETASTGAEGISRSGRSVFDVVVANLCLPDMRGFAFFEHVKEVDATIEVIAIADRGLVSVAVEAIRAGAFYFVKKPFEPDGLRLLVERALERRTLAAEGRALRDTLGTRDCSVVDPARAAAVLTACHMVRSGPYADIIGRSEPMRDIFATIESVARSDANILILGESGTGKELVANAIHARSLRGPQAFVKINCSALPRELIENELFGHVRGAFTGATHDKQGLIGLAASGSLLLDEIGAMPVELQPKLLRVLQERQYMRLGSEKLFKADFRLIASTNQRPEDAIRAGRLREDLYYRISTVTITIPPLRERAGDIELLADHMLKRFAEKYQKPITGFSSSARAAMLGYAWPGNVREVENAIERAVLLTRASTVEAAVLGSVVQKGPRPLSLAEEAHAATPYARPLVDPSADGFPFARSSAEVSFPRGMTLAQIECAVILEELRRAKGNKAAAADALGIYGPTLNNKIRRYRLTDYMPEERNTTAEWGIGAGIPRPPGGRLAGGARNH